MTRERRLFLWAVVLAVLVGLLAVLNDVLTPFVAGMAVAYFLDPLADRLERMGASRTLATSLILAGFFAFAVVLVVVLIPPLQAQVVGLLARVPDLLAAIHDQAKPIIERVQARISADGMAQLQEAARAYAGQAAKLLTKLIAGLWSGGMAVFNILSLMVITPLVSFYLLRDWDLIVARVDDLLPRDAAPTIRAQVAEIDRTIAGFVRGQATVCLILGAFYAVGLTAVGLDFGLLVGLGTGLISFIPYFGMAVGLVVGMGIAIAQFGSDWVSIALVAGVFAAGQVLEGFFLTPKLVGDKVGLHPVWVILALMAGGALFGFTGVLLAVPVAAVIGVMLRFSISHYEHSRLYHGHDWLPEVAGEGADAGRAGAVAAADAEADTAADTEADRGSEKAG
ncbi:MAG: AI-2E family transporter [Hyphomicrobiales bacterium]|nr:AI-2E family transporter [Hyphomicrobiales bacterium]MCP5374399.1 AI-2E family transporter [Hyphomicrobiales bacterium]